MHPSYRALCKALNFPLLHKTSHGKGSLMSKDQMVSLLNAMCDLMLACL